MKANTRSPKTPQWGDNPWRPNDPDRCPEHISARFGRIRMKGRCMLHKDHGGDCNLIDDGREQ